MARYEISNLDLADPTIVSGKELAEPGLSVSIQKKPGAAIILYRLIPKTP
jgi:hypothetical protein